MKIGKKIDKVRDEIRKGDATLANDLAREAAAAMLAGIGPRDEYGVVIKVTEEWKTVMTHFANDDAELARLCGKEQEFNATDWGLPCLAYILGDATCTAMTAETTGTKRTMKLQKGRNMLANLDAPRKNADKKDGNKNERTLSDFTGLDSTFNGI